MKLLQKSYSDKCCTALNISLEVDQNGIYLIAFSYEEYEEYVKNKK